LRVYSLPDCPKCDELKRWLTQKGIEYEARWFDTEAQTEFIMKNMFGNPPILEFNDAVKPSEELFEKEELRERILLEMLDIG
jgi:glutaredoxin